MTDCLFCKIASGEVAATKVYEDDAIVAIKDIDPQAPVHLLVMPRDHYSGIHTVSPEQHSLYQRLFAAVTHVVEQQQLAPKGYRLVINFGEKAGQSVPHIHVHILSGRAMQWPPG
jgi:histidine triad (HIT) family protein